MVENLFYKNTWWSEVGTAVDLPQSTSKRIAGMTIFLALSPVTHSFSMLKECEESGGEAKTSFQPVSDFTLPLI